MSRRTSKISRREFVRDAGGLVIGFSMLDSSLAPRLLAQSAVAAAKSPKRLESWLHVLPDGGVRVFTGKLMTLLEFSDDAIAGVSVSMTPAALASTLTSC